VPVPRYQHAQPMMLSPQNKTGFWFTTSSVVIKFMLWPLQSNFLLPSTKTTHVFSYMDHIYTVYKLMYFRTEQRLKNRRSVQSRGCRAMKWELLELKKFTMHFLDLKDWDWDSPIWPRSSWRIGKGHWPGGSRPGFKSWVRHLKLQESPLGCYLSKR
jgi:hypothetical protein